MAKTQTSASPRWNLITKLVIALTAVALVAGLVIRFHTIIGPILMAFVLAYLLHPVVAFINRKTPLSWRVAVNIVYLVFVLVLLALLTWGGVGLIGQIQNLITGIQTSIDELPAFIQSLSTTPITIGPYHISLSGIDWNTIGQQVLSYVEPAIGKIGGLVGSLASSAATTLAWTAFVVLVSYFFLLESGGMRHRMVRIDIPGFADDLHRLNHKLGRIWNAFLRGQIIIFVSTVIVYVFVLSILGVRYAIGIAILGGFATFLPYIGPTVTWVTLAIVTFLQSGNPLGWSPLAYTLLAVGLAVIIDQIFNNLVSPRIMAQALRVHPAAVLISAIIAASLLGLLGVILAAPLLATLQLIGRYALRKMFDEDPWPAEDNAGQRPSTPGLLRRIRRWWRKRLGKAPHPSDVEPAEPKTSDQAGGELDAEGRRKTRKKPV